MGDISSFGEESWITRVRKILPEFIPRPDTGRLWHDILFLFLIAALQFTIAPTFLGHYLVVDIMTPWLVVAFIRQGGPSAFVLALIGACIIETHTSAPAGVYICIYWIMHSVVMSVRATLSWWRFVPWLVTFILCETWAILFENFVAILQDDRRTYGVVYLLEQLLRLLLAVGIGMALRALCLKWDKRKKVAE